MDTTKRSPLDRLLFATFLKGRTSSRDLWEEKGDMTPEDNQKIIEETNVKIDIDDDGKVCIATYGENTDNAERAKAIILSIARDPEVGDMFIGSVVRVLSKVGAFVELAPGKDGMVHISKMSDKRINQVEDVLNIGDMVKVEIIKIGEKGIDLKLLEKIEA